MLLHLILAQNCSTFDCHGFSCKEFTLLNVKVPVCSCDHSVFTSDCRFCRNFKYSRSSNCSECVYSYLNPNRKCEECLDARLDVRKGCTLCKNRFDSGQECNACVDKHMDYARNCESCQKGYVLFRDAAISNSRYILELCSPIQPFSLFWWWSGKNGAQIRSRSKLMNSSEMKYFTCKTRAQYWFNRRLKTGLPKLDYQTLIISNHNIQLQKCQIFNFTL
ncbi:Hypothetical_protein [Hexamita inflata]|uniref:Hypothetical_protein n=1 Tax=Hexamita inflata TaxID=28002 RepID=A0AA86QR37_9EUKA|nr:Hypothetical protein HINF_LOCUS46627 [Hexamita inflata]